MTRIRPSQTPPRPQVQAAPPSTMVEVVPAATEPLNPIFRSAADVLREGLSTPLFTSLQMELARRQLKLRDAQAHLMGLAQVPARPTVPALEEGVQAILAACSVDVSHSALDALVSEASRQGPAGLQMCVEILQAQAHAFRAQLPAAAQAAFGAGLQRVLDGVSTRACQVLAQVPVVTDRAAALATIIGWRGALSVEADIPLYQRGHAFTNETGLGAALASVDVQGGVAAGASGGILDLAAAARAEAVLSVDVNGGVADALIVLSGILLVVDGLCERHGFDDERRAAEVALRVECFSLNPGGPLSLPQAVAELEALGLSRANIAGWPDVLPQMFLMPERSSWLYQNAPDRVAHLSRLALQGRILPMTADLACPQVRTKVGAACAALQLPVSVMNLSNVLDYVVQRRAVVDNLAALPWSSDAVLVATTDSPALPGAAFGDHAAPGVSGVQGWFGPGGFGETVASSLDGAPPDPSWWAMTTKPLAALGVAIPDAPAPTTVAELSARRAELISNAFVSPAMARSTFAQAVEVSGRRGAYVVALGAGPASRLPMAAPHSIQELRQSLHVLDQQVFSSPKRKQAVFVTLLAPGTTLPNDELLQRRLQSCQTFDDLKSAATGVKWSAAGAW